MLIEQTKFNDANNKLKFRQYIRGVKNIINGKIKIYNSCNYKYLVIAILGPKDVKVTGCNSILQIAQINGHLVISNNKILSKKKIDAIITKRVFESNIKSLFASNY